ncbi:hypothetical protein B0A49_11130 [Cryomyces minteri]|uniref:Levodione reductase n=1 Tax=Cryomyces minteri TaxID=331657 RepID=A0A4U0WJG3_9PEZI|nr:hypothetical protein B0A49_11130 [Cryomyces minteri]
MAAHSSAPSTSSVAPSTSSVAGFVPSSSSLAGRVFAITGGASGIGLATAQLLLERGTCVSIADIDGEALIAAHDSLGLIAGDERILPTLLDISNAASVDHWIKRTIETMGRLDGAANIAGVIGKIHGVKNLGDMPDKEFDRIIKVNLYGTMHCMRAQINAILNQSPSYGSIVNASSIQGLLGFANHAAYSASKHGVQGLTKSAAKEYGQKGIRINAVAPGEINTPLMDKANAIHGEQWHAANTAMKRMGSPQEVAACIVFLLSDESSFVTGATISCDGGWNC